MGWEIFFLKAKGGALGRRSSAPPPCLRRKKSPNSLLNPRNFENFRPKTLRQLNPVITRLGAPLEIRPRSRLIPLQSHASAPGLCLLSPLPSPLISTHTHTHYYAYAALRKGSWHGTCSSTPPLSQASGRFARTMCTRKRPLDALRRCFGPCLCFFFLPELSVWRRRIEGLL